VRLRVQHAATAHQFATCRFRPGKRQASRREWMRRSHPHGSTGARPCASRTRTRLTPCGSDQEAEPERGSASSRGQPTCLSETKVNRRREPAPVTANSGASTGNSAPRAGDSSLRQSDRLPGLPRAPVPDSVHSSVARFVERAAGWNPVLRFELAIFAASICSPKVDAAVRPRVCVQMVISCQFVWLRR
jgi:hypothetical protein